MKKPVDSWSGMKTGYGSRSKWDTLNNKKKKNKNSANADNYDKKYPNGMIPFFTIMIALIIGIILVMTIRPSYAHGGNLYLKLNWYWNLFYLTGAAVALIVFWTLGRFDFLSSVRFGMMKFARTVRLADARRKLKYKVIESAIDDVENLQEWEEFTKIRKKHTKKWFVISWITYGSLFGISIIIMLIMDYAVNV